MGIDHILSGEPYDIKKIVIGLFYDHTNSQWTIYVVAADDLSSFAESPQTETGVNERYYAMKVMSDLHTQYMSIGGDYNSDRKAKWENDHDWWYKNEGNECYVVEPDGEGHHVGERVLSKNGLLYLEVPIRPKK